MQCKIDNVLVKEEAANGCLLINIVIRRDEGRECEDSCVDIACHSHVGGL